MRREKIPSPAKGRRIYLRCHQVWGRETEGGGRAVRRNIKSCGDGIMHVGSAKERPHGKGKDYN